MGATTIAKQAHPSAVEKHRLPYISYISSNPKSLPPPLQRDTSRFLLIYGDSDHLRDHHDVTASGNGKSTTEIVTVVAIMTPRVIAIVIAAAAARLLLLLLLTKVVIDRNKNIDSNLTVSRTGKVSSNI